MPSRYQNVWIVGSHHNFYLFLFNEEKGSENSSCKVRVLLCRCQHMILINSCLSSSFSTMIVTTKSVVPVNHDKAHNLYHVLQWATFRVLVYQITKLFTEFSLTHVISSLCLFVLVYLSQYLHVCSIEDFETLICKGV